MEVRHYTGSTVDGEGGWRGGGRERREKREESEWMLEDDLSKVSHTSHTRHPIRTACKDVGGCAATGTVDTESGPDRTGMIDKRPEKTPNPGVCHR